MIDLKIKRQPQRKCVGCAVSHDKKDLIRVVREEDNKLSLDLKGVKQSRGAYICKSEDCLKKALKTRKFERSYGKNKNFGAIITPEFEENIRSLF